ncbi:DeoR/GlpR family DNA-binding transcription regulator [Thalassobacillus sp. CUG 92003]|uniref:DeoR/GlpR family DNA-binding transcription regulator n=1 Tax=Thalassobacillus sp. CUG 92003 TaxID=2736641 RepID=UPI0015E6FDDD|nr:DeoR/GlpR family DNA-binding transcription regulator [Thalassobacillus sp. CUG 92003]
MYQEERLISIMDHLRQQGRITINQICSIFNVSRDTARRDLVRLEEDNVIIRTRGGAILPSSHNTIKDYSHRLETGSEEKREIGKRAASLIRPGDTVILDASTTVEFCTEQIDNMDGTYITNSINQADILSSNSEANIHLLGGLLHKEHKFLYGTSVIDKLSHYHVNKAFIGVVGISEHGLTLAHEEDGMVKRKIVQQSKQVIALADHSKIGITDLFQYATLDEIDLLITDQTPEADFLDLLDTHHVELLVTQSDQ